MKIIVMLLILASCASHQISKKEVNYSTESTKLQGFIAYKKDGKKKPGIIIVHEWWGHNEFVRDRARDLAELGYVAFAIDMYGKGKKTEHPKEAKEFMTQTMSNMPEAKARIEEAFKILKQHKMVQSEKIGAIGYCFGGAVVLQAVQMGLDIDAAATFHGSLAAVKHFPKDSKTKLLVQNGADDPMVTKEHIANLKTKAAESNLELTFLNYADSKHAFTNPGATEKGEKYNLPLAYNKKADKQSWERMTELFEQVLK